MPRGISAEELNLAVGTIVRVSKEGRTYKAITADTGEDIADKLESYALKNAFKANKALKLFETKAGSTVWRHVPQSEFEMTSRGEKMSNLDTSSLTISPTSEYSFFDDHEELVDFISKSPSLKPPKLQIDDLTWKFAIRTALRGRNMLVVGPTGCGKTLLANSIKVALGREDKFFYVDMGGTQDARSTLIGNTHFNKEQGTFVSLSYFAEAIQIPDAIILLDEASRMHPDAGNILMPVLDYTQRYLRADERADSATIRVAPGVTFILTANVGAEYTFTRTMDRALLDRCTIVEMKPLSKKMELDNLSFMFPSMNAVVLDAVAEIASQTRLEFESDSPKIDTIISTRMSEEWAGCINDGLSFVEAAKTCVIPFFSAMGGTESPRAYIMQMIQKFDGIEKTTSPPSGNDPINDIGSTPWS